MTKPRYSLNLHEKQIRQAADHAIKELDKMIAKERKKNENTNAWKKIKNWLLHSKPPSPK